MDSNFWKDKMVSVCGGASFIASHTIPLLLELGANVDVFDDLSSGKKENTKLPVYVKNFRNYEDAWAATAHANIVLDFSSVHGGRGFVGGGHDVAISDNLVINTNVLRAAVENKVERIAFASSGCVYDTTDQMDETIEFTIPENWIYMKDWEMLAPDGMYGTTKLMHEKVLGAYHRAGLIKTAICRFFTVFGPRMTESHFICASIAKTFIRQDPFYVWGSPDIVRNFTPVQNTVQGFLLAAELANGEPYNIGMEQRITINESLEKIWELMNWHPKDVIYQPDKPVGIRNRVSDCTKARTELGWKPDVSFDDGLKETIEWYVQTHDVETVRENLERKMTER